MRKNADLKSIIITNFTFFLTIVRLSLVLSKYYLVLQLTNQKFRRREGKASSVASLFCISDNRRNSRPERSGG